jgi:hypothetical protein
MGLTYQVFARLIGLFELRAEPLTSKKKTLKFQEVDLIDQANIRISKAEYWEWGVGGAGQSFLGLRDGDFC